VTNRDPSIMIIATLQSNGALAAPKLPDAVSPLHGFGPDWPNPTSIRAFNGIADAKAG